MVVPGDPPWLRIGEICHTLLQYLEEQTILNVLSILAGAGDQYLEPVPRPDPKSTQKRTEQPKMPWNRQVRGSDFEALMGSKLHYRTGSKFFLRPGDKEPEKSILWTFHVVSSGFGVETANISILAGPGSGARVQYIANTCREGRQESRSILRGSQNQIFANPYRKG